MQYCVGADYFWLLVEGLYLHNLLVLMVFSENSYFSGYLVVGWGQYLARSGHVGVEGGEFQGWSLAKHSCCPQVSQCRILPAIVNV
uniref:G-protein coupled receptors family 2 profile 2 domain-containing protein n=1 Tax=Anguilla anguilla TaxID=7936 RepID=A0A0E9Q5F7_ANGAN